MLDVLASSDLDVVRIVGSSAGALNGAAFAAACRAGRREAGAREIVDVWRDEAGFGDVFHLRPRDWLPFRGLADQKKVLGILRDSVKVHPPVRPINLKLIVTTLDGDVDRIGPPPGDPRRGACVDAPAGFDATTYEHVCDFADADFDTDDGLGRVFDAAVASAALPGAFAPYRLPGVGLCIDGGATNNTPIGHALDGELGQRIDAVIVIAPTVELRPPVGDLAGLPLAGHLVDVLINERLYRDLKLAEDLNMALDALDRLVTDGVLDARQLAAVKQALAWQEARRTEIVRIRPLEPVPGDVLSGFWHREQREALIEIGRERAKQVLAAWC